MGLPIKERVKLEGTWDFDEDGGATGRYSLVSVPANFAVYDMFYEVETAITSGGTPTVEIGDGDDDNGYFTDFESSMGSTGVKGLNQDDKGVYLWDDTNDAADRKLYSSADDIELVVGSATLTAGKLKLTVIGERLS